MIQADGNRNLLRILQMLTILAALGLIAWPSICLGQSPIKIIKVIVDPGHGGEDTGSKGSGGVFEKEITLGLARKMAEAMEETGTIRAVLTRTDDYSISLDDRAGLAHHRGGDLLISLHLGNSFQPVLTGLSVYYWSPVTATPAVSPPTNKTLAWDQKQESYWENSRRLATMIQQELHDAVSWPTGGVLQGNLYLLRRVKMPAVVLELGSLNHPGEAAELQKPEFQEAVARALTEAIIKYRDTQEEEIRVPDTEKQ